MQNFIRITASQNLAVPAGVRLSRVRLVNTGAGQVSAVLFNKNVQGVIGDATDFCTLVTTSPYDDDKENWGTSEGMKMDSGVSVTITGTGGIMYLYYY